MATCMSCGMPFINTDDTLTYDHCKHRIHLRCLERNIKQLGVSNCVICIPLISKAGRMGVLPLDIGCDANLKAVLAMVPVTDVQALRSSTVVSPTQKIVKTDLSADYSPLGQFTGVAGIRISRMKDGVESSNHTALKIADTSKSLADLGVTAVDVLQCRMTFAAWIKSGRTIEDLLGLGIDVETMISKMDFGKKWPKTDYSQIGKHGMTFATLVQCGFSGDLESAMATRIPLEVYKALGVQLRDIVGQMNQISGSWYYLNHIPLANLIDDMNLTNTMIVALQPDLVFVKNMKWSVEELQDRLQVTLFSVS